ncbi:MAG: PBP1A family penicillin-binding protein [Candidatus Binatia bacterium]|nr:PBP1A family penicillin-binding protein [Candidatus Binatia bacterium]
MRQAREDRQARGWWRTLQLFFFSLGLILVVGTTLAGVLIYRELTEALPPLDQVVNYRAPTATQIFARDGTLVGEFYDERRYVVPLERIPAIVRNAFIAAEDDQFYQHKGIDPAGMVRALIHNLSGGGGVQGGSTITQQVVKQILLTPRKSYERKLKEILLAIRLENTLSKDDILYLYLNHIYLGSGAYGVAAAAEVYFGKSVDQLSVAEAALLAGLPQAPSRYSPLRHWVRAKARQRYVLERMAAVGFITPAEAVLAAQEPIALRPRRGNVLHAPYYVEHVRRLLEQRYGGQSAYQMGLQVFTALDLRLQSLAEQALRDGIAALEERQRYSPALRSLNAKEQEQFLAEQTRMLAGKALEPERSYEALVVSTRDAVRVRVGPFSGVLDTSVRSRLRAGDVVRVRLRTMPGDNGRDPAYDFVVDSDSLVQGAAVVLDPSTGDVLALVGGTNFQTSQFNRATQARRQPGSAFKPFVYAAAFDDRYTPASVIVDAPVAFPDNNGVWAPQNYEHRFFGPTTLRDALTFSRNVPTVKLAQQIGLRRLIPFVRSLGIRSPLPPNLSIALGAAEVTPLELVTAYSVFANQGVLVEPRFIVRLSDQHGQPIEQNEPQRRAVLSPETAYLVTDVLQDVIERGTGQRAKALGRPAAGKTGTTNDMNDAWFIGYTPQLLAGFWVGFDSKRSLGKGETGGRVAAPIWLSFMREALADQPVLDFPIPSGIRFVAIDRHTGQRAAPTAPGAVLECFRAGTEPKWEESVGVEEAKAQDGAPTSLRDRPEAPATASEF